MADQKNKKSTREKEEVLTLDVIKDLGGTQEDLKLLTGVDDDSDSQYEDDDEDFDAEPVKKDEIRDFIKQLQIYQHRPGIEGEDDDETENKDKKEKKEKKKKLLVAPGHIDEEPSTSETPPVEGKKKKEKNKFKVQHDEVTSTTKDPTTEYKNHIKNYHKRKQMLVKTGECFDETKAPGGQPQKFGDEIVKQMEDFASKLLQDEVLVYNKQREHTKRSDVRWMKTVLTSGTLADKIAALNVLIQESPVHNLSQLDNLINMAKKKGRRENIQAIDALKEIFLTNIMPGNRKLRLFSQQPLSSVGPLCSWNKEAMDKKLMLWYFEEELKKRYTEFVNILQKLAHDTLLSTRQKVVSIAYNLLVNKPEQEKPLLNLLVNKVGDPHYKLASTVSHLLTKLVEQHPNMKGVVVREVEYLLFRPNIADRAQYYSVCFLNQIRLSSRDKDLASKLIHIYFSFFKAFVKKGEVDSKMMSGLLSGVNRAYPFAELEEQFLNQQLEHLYKIVHIVNFTTSVQALTLLYQVMDTNETISERYYNALYKKLVDPALKSSSKQAVFLNLLYKSMKKDESDRRIKAFMKRLLQVCSYQQPQFTCGALILLSEVLKAKKGLLSIQHTEEDSDEEEHFVDAADEDEEEADTPATPDGDDDAVDDDGDVDVKPVGMKPQGISWVHRANLNHKSEKTDYDPFHRNPQYCHAEKEVIWELENLVNHFHPSVSLFAARLLKGQLVRYTGDPLQDFTLIRFLDRFVFKNPKKKDEDTEKATTMFRKDSIPTGIKGMAVTSDRFLKLDEKRVPADDLFLYRYFQQKSVKDRKKAADDDSDVESITDAEFDDFLDKHEGHMDADDFADFDVDFSTEFGKKKVKGSGDGSDDDSDDDLDDDLSDEEVDFEDDELARAFKAEMIGGSDDDDDDDGEFADADEYADKFGDDDDDDDGGDFDEEDISFSGDDDEFQDMMPKGKKRKPESSGNMVPAKRGKKLNKTSGDVDASAEEFALMMDDTAGSKYTGGGSHALANPDKADVKQLKWEVERDRWIKGGNKFKKGGGKFSQNRPGPRDQKGGKFKKNQSGGRGKKGGGKSGGFRYRKGKK